MSYSIPTSFMAPPFIMAFSICIGLGLKYIINPSLNPISTEVFQLIFMAIGFFGIGFYMMTIGFPRIVIFRKFTTITFSGSYERVIKVIFVVSITISMFIFGTALMQLNYDTASVRSYYIENQHMYLIAPHLLYFCATYFLLRYLKTGNISYSLFFISAALVNSVIKLEKSSFTTFIWALSVVQWTVGRGSAKSYLRLVAIILIGALFISAMFIFREDNGPELLLISIVNYISIPFLNFEYNILNSPVSGCTNVFGAIAKYGAPESFCRPEVFDTYGHYNVYSFLFEPFILSGYLSLSIVYFILGAIYAVIYDQNRRSDFGRVLYAFVTYPLVICFFAYGFNWNEWIYILIFLIIHYKMAKKYT